MGASFVTEARSSDRNSRASEESGLSLGNPLAFAIVAVLGEGKELNPSEIARAVGRSVSRVSHVLAGLRLAEVVRYESDGRQARYRLKHSRETQQLLEALAKLIDSSSAF